MEESINQAFLFFIFIICGIFIGVLFDIFRILRKSFKTADIVTYIQDCLFWILVGIILIYFIFIFNKGELRAYLFSAIIIGNITYMLYLSKLIIKISLFIIEYIKKIVKKMLIPIYIICKKMFNKIKKAK